MSRRGKEKAGIIVRKEPGGIRPVAAIDAETIDGLPVGTEFDLVPRTKRSLPQHRTYWKALGDVVKATGIAPTSEHLHEALKRDLGYVAVRNNLLGLPYLATDSTAIDEMSAPEFSAYFEAAMARLAEVTHIDPLAFLEEAA